MAFVKENRKLLASTFASGAPARFKGGLSEIKASLRSSNLYWM
jgi:hypothetical protein